MGNLHSHPPEHEEHDIRPQDPQALFRGALGGERHLQDDLFRLIDKENCGSINLRFVVEELPLLNITLPHSLPFLYQMNLKKDGRISHSDFVLILRTNASAARKIRKQILKERRKSHSHHGHGFKEGHSISSASIKDGKDRDREKDKDGHHHQPGSTTPQHDAEPDAHRLIPKKIISALKDVLSHPTHSAKKHPRLSIALSGSGSGANSPAPESPQMSRGTGSPDLGSLGTGDHPPVRVISLNPDSQPATCTPANPTGKSGYKAARMLRSHGHHHLTVVPGCTSGKGKNTSGGPIPMYSSYHFINHSDSSEDEEVGEVEISQAIADRIDRQYVDTLSKMLHHSEIERQRYMDWLFRLVDLDRDDKICLQEFTIFLKALNADGINLKNFSYDTVDDATLVQAILAEYDHDQKGYLTRDEFMVLADLVVYEYLHYASKHMDSVGQFELARCVGEGSEGIVRCALDVDSGGRYAIKIVPRGKCTNLSRLDREIQALTMLNHPNIVRIHSVMEDDEYIFIVMELCGGGSLF